MNQPLVRVSEQLSFQVSHEGPQVRLRISCAGVCMEGLVTRDFLRYLADSFRREADVGEVVDAIVQVAPVALAGRQGG